MNHLPECSVPWIRECICTELQMAYARGRQDGINGAINTVSRLWEYGYDRVILQIKALDNV